jgi:YD repeat-containing protein
VAEIHSWLQPLGAIALNGKPVPSNYTFLEDTASLYGAFSDFTQQQYCTGLFAPILNEGICVGPYGVAPSTAWRWEDAAGAGLAGHIYAQSVLNQGGSTVPQYYQTMYFKGGVYNPALHSFTVGATNSPYITIGPDWRQQMYYIDNDVFANEGYHAGMETQIFHNGSLAQKELAVVTNVDATVFDYYQNDYPSVEAALPYQILVYENDCLGHPTNITVLNTNTGEQRVIYEADYKGGGSLPGDLLLSETDEAGIVTIYQYDSLKRLVAITKTGISGPPYQADLVTNKVYDASSRLLEQVVTGSALSSTNAWVYDLSGRLTSSVDSEGLVTSITYQSGGQIITTNLPSGASVVRANYLDRRLHSITGNGSVSEYHTYDVESLPSSSLTYLDTVAPFFDTTTVGNATSPRWHKSGVGASGVTELSEVPDFGGGAVLTTFSPLDSTLQQAGTEKPGQDLTWSYNYFDGVTEDQRTSNTDPDYYELGPQGGFNSGPAPGGNAGYGPPLVDEGRISQCVRQFVQKGGVWF